MKDTLKDTVRSLLIDIEAMRCRCPDEMRDMGDRDDEPHWFGTFGRAYDDEAGCWIEWPNLSIMAEKLQSLLDRDTIDGIPAKVTISDEEREALGREVERYSSQDDGRSDGFGESYAERNV
jgi:hypothetical protein